MAVIITGATKGIGRAIAYKFAEHGHNIAICARNQDDLIAMGKDLLSKYDVRVMSDVCDVSNPDEVKRFGSVVVDSFDDEQIILVNNAGVFLPGELSQEAEGTLERMIETNLYSAYNLTRALLPTIIKNGKGHIFNMCSVASKIAYPNGGSYSISKFALLGFTKVLREELKSSGVKVTAILPGATWSDSWSGVDLPHDRLMEAQDIADAVYATYALGPSAVVEEIVLRPLLGDL